MLTNRLLKLTVFAGIGLAMPVVAARSDDKPAAVKPTVVATPSAAPVATKAPLTSKEVWGHDFAQAKQQAKKLNRPMLLHFHATWCGPCQQMERDVLNSAKVLREINARCVAVKIDCDRQPALVQQFAVEALPCDVFVTPEGKVLRVNQGFSAADQYTALISQAVKTKAAAPIAVTKK